MTTTHHHRQFAPLHHLGQALGRLLDAIAASADYQQNGHVTYQSIGLGRWQCGEHFCGSATINTAARNELVRIEAVSSTTRTLALTEEGRRHASARQARRKADQR